MALAVNIKGDSFEGMNALLNTDIPAWGDYQLTGHALWSEDRLHLSNINGHIGATHLKGTLQLDLRPTPYYLNGNITAETFDWGLFTHLKQHEKSAQPPSPEGLFPISAALAISIHEVVNAPMKLNNISISPQISRDSLQVLSQFTIEDLTVIGQLDLAQADNKWHASLAFSAKDADLLRLGRRFWGDKLNQAYVQRLMLNASVMGVDVASCINRLDNITITNQVRQSHLHSTAFGVTIGPTRFYGDLEVDFTREPEEAIFTVKANHVHVGATLEYLNIAEDLDVSAQRPQLRLLARKKNPMNWLHSLSLTIDASELRYLLAGTGSFGPDTIHGGKAHFFTATGQHSRLEGDLDYNTTMSPPRFLMNLKADFIQLDDFDLGDWPPIAKENRQKKTEQRRSDGESYKKAPNRHALISRDLVNGLDGKIEVTINEVRSGRDRLGKAKFEANVANSALEIAPLFLELPGEALMPAFASILSPTE